jgi:HSP20 family molecular chaperone IbpA
MILLRRGRQTHGLESGLEFDVMVDFRQAPVRSTHPCLGPWRPPIDVFETARGLVVRAELGGLTTNEVQVLLSGDEVVIRGERVVDPHLEQRVYHESRVRYGHIEAAVRLPFAVDVESATADYADGFLSIHLPRLAATKVTTREERGAGLALKGD